MKNKDIVANAAADLVFTLLSCVFAAIFSTMIVKLVNKFVQLSFISNAGLKTVALLIFAAFFLVFLSYKHGYHCVCFDKVGTVISALLAALVHFILSLSTLFSPWVSGATKPLSGFIRYGTNYMSESQTKNIPMMTLVMTGLVVALIYVGLVVLGTHLGTKKRLADRAELTGEKTNK